jgi:hypothetical protein
MAVSIDCRRVWSVWGCGFVHGLDDGEQYRAQLVGGERGIDRTVGGITGHA